jgi:hypothetical protein
MTFKGYLICAAGLALVVAGVFMYRDHVQAKQDQVHIEKANADQATAHSEAAKGAADVKPMQDERGQVAQDTTANQTINTKLAADWAGVANYNSRPVPGPGSPAVPTADAVAEPPESPRELAKDQLITDLNTALAGRDKTIADQAALIATTTDYGQHEHAAYTQDEAAVGELRQAIHPTYTHGLGLVYGTSQTVGVIAEQDISRVRIGAQVLLQNLPALAGGKTQVLATVHAIWRF